MQRRRFTAHLAAGMAFWLGAHKAHALDSRDANAGLKAALDRGAASAVALLGRTDGFLGNPKVRIALPSGLESATKLLRSLGQGRKVDDLVTAMNRAAEEAVVEAKPLLANAVKQMTLTDAKAILAGGDTSVTRFFADKTRVALSAKFLPIVTRTTEKFELSAKYNAVAGQAAGLGIVEREDANLQKYVTSKTLDGLFLMIGEEEKNIRRNPAATGSAILQKVFGSL